MRVIDIGAMLGPYPTKRRVFPNAQDMLGFMDKYLISDVVAHMDCLGIDCAVTIPHTLVNGCMEETNLAAYDAAVKYSGRFFCYIAVLPHQGMSAVKEQLDKYKDNKYFVGLKFLPKYHGSLQQPEYDYALDFAAEMRCPVLCHNYND